MLGSIDEKVKILLLILRRKGGVVNSVVAIAAAQALIQKSSDEHLKCIDLVSFKLGTKPFSKDGFCQTNAHHRQARNPRSSCEGG